MSTPISDAVLESVLSQYPLAAPHVLGPVEASKRNDSFLVEDAAGDRYVLRRYRRNPDEARILFQLRFQQELYRRGFPTSRIVEAEADELFVASEAGPWAVFGLVEGCEFDFARVAQVAEAGRRLAQFHTVSESIELEHVALDVNPDARRWWTRGEDELAALDALFRGRGVDEELAFVRDWAAELRDGMSLDALERLPAGWAHGDYHGRNMVFVEDELGGLFDFDVLYRGLYVEDVAYGLFMFGREFRGSRRIRPEAAQLFLDGYDRVRALADDERALLPVMMALGWSPRAAYYALMERDGEDAVAFFQRDVSFVRDLQAEAQRLRPLLVAG